MPQHNSHDQRTWAVDDWLHTQTVIEERHAHEQLGRKRWDMRHQNKYQYSTASPAAPNGTPIDSSYMSLISNVPDQVVEAERADRRAILRRNVGMKTARPEPNLEAGDTWTPGRGYRGSWAPLKANDPKGRMSFDTSAHEMMKCQDPNNEAKRRAMSTPLYCPAYPSINKASRLGPKTGRRAGEMYDS